MSPTVIFRRAAAARAALPLVLAPLVFGACSGTRDTDGLGPAHAAYVQARDAQPPNNVETLRRFYEAYLEAMRSKDPKKAMRFFRPDVEPEAQNAMRLGVEFVKLLDSLSGELLDVRDLGNRATLKTRETASYKFRNKPSQDRRDRTLQLVKVGKDWYIDAPDLGNARKAR